MLGILVVIHLARNAHADLGGNIANTCRKWISGVVSKCNELAIIRKLRRIRTAIPDPLVQVGVNPNIFGAHELGDEFADFFDSTRRLLLKSTEGQSIRKG